MRDTVNQSCASNCSSEEKIDGLQMTIAERGRIMRFKQYNLHHLVAACIRSTWAISHALQFLSRLAVVRMTDGQLAQWPSINKLQRQPGPTKWVASPPCRCGRHAAGGMHDYCCCCYCHCYCYFYRYCCHSFYTCTSTSTSTSSTTTTTSTSTTTTTKYTTTWVWMGHLQHPASSSRQFS